MKTKRKALLLSLCAVLLVVASVMGTMAYLTSSATVTNTFTVGDAVTITLDEADVNDDGTVIADADRVTENSYKLMPGHEYTKDPTVHVTGGECYVFVKVTNGLGTLEADTNTIADQMADKGWKAVAGVEGVYIYNVSAEGDKTAVSGTTENPTNLTVFEKFTIKDGAVREDLTKASDIVIKAYAVQTDGFESKTPAEIWNTALKDLT